MSVLGGGAARRGSGVSLASPPGADAGGKVCGGGCGSYLYTVVGGELRLS